MFLCKGSNWLKHLLDLCGHDSQLYNGHSFRIGAATSAGKNNIEDHLIKILGRWNSSSYCLYIKTCKSVIKKAQQKLLCTYVYYEDNPIQT
jgi:hypothetical protein